ncbi:MAG: hypothetical protein HY216_10705 [Candidatus Rokubacteria bacterium]|nr:hypothetical protein [Candidatus Rokubacteria bacterium]
MAKPAAPERVDPTTWEHYKLWQRVRDAILALPVHFKSETTIEGMLATDIFTLNTALGATIEEQVVATLNALRPVWDPDKEYQTYGFVRQTQTFPDVILRKKTNGQDILLGIELKGWYILAKEGVPTFRFSVTPSACHPWDLIVVVPWALSNILAGSPVVYPVFIDIARYTAEQRNYYWQYERSGGGSREVILASGATPYPIKSDKIQDKPAVADGNFGRLARYGIMGEFVRTTMQTPVRGIPASEWLSFFKSGVEEAEEATPEAPELQAAERPPRYRRRSE